MNRQKTITCCNTLTKTTYQKHFLKNKLPHAQHFIKILERCLISLENNYNEQKGSDDAKR